MVFIYWLCRFFIFRNRWYELNDEVPYDFDVLYFDAVNSLGLSDNDFLNEFPDDFGSQLLYLGAASDNRNEYPGPYT